MKKLLASLVGAICLFGAAANAAEAPKATKTAPLVITFDPGGSIFAFIEKYEAIAASHQKVEVKGECISACTLMLGILDHSQVCVSQQAMFGFHSATAGDAFSEQGTQVVWYMYPLYVRQLLSERGLGPNIEHPELVWVPGTRFYQQCP